jgi:predicted site-specific integrase-resolvase
MNKRVTVNGPLYTTSPAAAKAGCSSQTIRRFANEGRIEHLKAEGNHIIVTERGVEQAKKLLASKR